MRLSSWDSFLAGFDLSRLWSMLISAAAALLCITLHELSHGYVAYRLGDDTAKNAGRLTLNPIKHLDLLGFVMLVVAHVGWAKPVPVDMRKFENPKRGMAITALAGPVSNMLITVVFLFLYGVFAAICSAHDWAISDYLLRFLSLTALISLGLGLFNLLPIPPLDGSKVLFSLIPDQSYLKLMRYERYGVFILIGLAAAGVTGRFLDLAINAVLDLFSPVAVWGLKLGFILLGA
ncbi:MAG: site-2 protease family protein [Oscillospiraceae bacterium]|nr:site-2 protease family protein [Oscillospiraceae bacterium]